MAKYVIYKQGEDMPLEVWQYIDDVKEASKYWYVRDAIDKYGFNDVMPIVMNEAGGYHTCYQPYVKCIIESDYWPALHTHKELFNDDINSPSFRCGWIDPLGNTYKCDYMGHLCLAESLCKLYHEMAFNKWKIAHNNLNAPDDFLIEKGYIKVFNSPPYHAVLYDKVSEKALKTLDDLEIKLGRI